LESPIQKDQQKGKRNSSIRQEEEKKRNSVPKVDSKPEIKTKIGTGQNRNSINRSSATLNRRYSNEEYLGESELPPPAPEQRKPSLEDEGQYGEYPEEIPDISGTD
jgi:hypothetical protein